MTIALGHKSVKECQRWISSHEFAEWMAYFNMEPFGDDLLDQSIASLQALMANIHSDPKKGRKFKPDDFVLRKMPEPEDDEPLSNKEIFNRLKANLGLR